MTEEVYDLQEDGELFEYEAGEGIELDPVEIVSEIQEEQLRPFLTTEFSDYSVTEGLLLALLLFSFLSVCVRVLKEGFFWL